MYMNNQKWKKVLYGVKLPPDILGIIKSVKNTQNERGSKKKYIKIELRENTPTLFPNSLYSTTKWMKTNKRKWKYLQ